MLGSIIILVILILINAFFASAEIAFISLNDAKIDLLAKEGDKVKEGDSLAVIEAMKMETNIVASTDGTIESIKIKEGQQVKTGELLIKLK